MFPFAKIETEEDVYAAIDANYRHPSNLALKGIYRIFKEQFPEESVQELWLRTLNHIIAIFEKE